MTGQHAEAVERYEEALNIEVQLRDMQGIAVTQSQLGLAHRELFQFAEACYAFHVALELFHRLQSPNYAVIERALSGISDHLDYSTILDEKKRAQSFVSQLIAAPTLNVSG